MWPDRRIIDLFGIEFPILQAPMAGPCYADMAIAVAEAGGLGSLPTATLTPDKMRSELQLIRQQTAKPINLNFFCHQPPSPDAAREEKWRQRLKPYYSEFEIDPAAPIPSSDRAPFNEALCQLVEE